MKPLEHTSALGWIIGLAATVWLVGGVMAVTQLNSYRGEGLALALGVTGFGFAILVPSVVGAIVLHGVKQMLQQVREPVVMPARVQSLQERADHSSGGGESRAAEGAVGDAGVDLRGGDGGVPEQPLDR